MKRHFIFLFIFLLGFNFISKGQINTFGSDNGYGYKWTNNLNNANPAAYNWVDISTDGTLLRGLGDDNILGPISLNIDFKFFWNTYNSCYVGSNGYIMFEDNALIAQSGTGMPNIPYASDKKGNFIAPFLADLTFVTHLDGKPLKGAKVLYATLGTRFVITYDSVRFWNNNPEGGIEEASGLITFQLVLDASDNSIQVNYKSAVGPYFTSGRSSNFVTMGIENMTGQLGARFRRNQLPPPNSAVKVVYPLSSTYVYKNVEAHALFTNDNKGDVAFTDIPKVLRAYLRNTGTVKVKTRINANITIIDNDADTAVYNETLIIDSMQVAEQRLLTYPLLLDPGNTAKSFKVEFRANTSGDQNNGDNSVFNKIIVLDSTEGSVNLKFTKATLGNAGNVRGITTGGMVFDPPYIPMVIKQISVDVIWPDTAVFARPPFNEPFAIDSFSDTRVLVYLGDGPGGTIGTLIDSFRVTNDSLEHDTLGYEITLNERVTNILRFKRTLPFPYLWDSDKRIYIGVFHDLKGNVFWNPPYAEYYDANTPSSGRSLEITGGIWSEYREKDSLDVGVGIIGDPLAPTLFNFSVANNKFCAGESFDVPFTTTGNLFNSGNVFSLQLSDVSGSFASPKVIGTLPGTAVGTIQAQLPTDLPDGDGYKIRVLSSSPLSPGGSGSTILYIGKPIQPTILGNSRFCAMDSNIIYRANGIGNASKYIWSIPSDARQLSGDTTNTIAVKFGTNSGQISVNAVNRCGVGPVKTQNVFVNTTPIDSLANVLTSTSLSAAAYQWYLNDAPISGANRQKYTILESGNYSVEVTFSTGCKIRSAIRTMIITSLTELVSNEGSLRVWPNPSRSVINLEFGAKIGKVRNVEIRNSLGQLVQQTNIEDNNEVKAINVSSWSEGIYYVRAMLMDGSQLQQNLSISK